VKPVRIILRRELASYFITPIAYVVLIIFLFGINLLTFMPGALFEREQADLQPFFTWMPWMFLILIPALTMRLWAEERRNGTIELLLTQPVTLFQAVLGKFLAAWLMVGIALALTFPVWLTVIYLGKPDNGTILAAYIGSFLMAAGFLAIGSFTSSITKNQLIAFLLAVVLSFLLIIIGFPWLTEGMRDKFPQWLVDGIASLSFFTHFQNITKGVLDLRDLLYFALVTIFFLLASTVVLDARKSK
jgi:ABC-2 type transport system permease protein